jgi:recombinational DNA repair protein RecR
MLQKGIPESIARLINELSKLPGIGEKNATRLAFHIFRSSRESAENLSKAITDAKTKVCYRDVLNFATERHADCAGMKEICHYLRRDPTSSQ